MTEVSAPDVPPRVVTWPHVSHCSAAGQKIYHTVLDQLCHGEKPDARDVAAALFLCGKTMQQLEADAHKHHAQLCEEK